jgi:DNA-binding PadR family transcriptional regulator
MRRLSITACSVLQALVAGARYGFDVIERTGLPSGTVYPALSRLERDGYAASAWEAEADAHAAGRPARRYYRVTAPGLRALSDATRHYQSLLPALHRPLRGRT